MGWWKYPIFGLATKNRPSKTFSKSLANALYLLPTNKAIRQIGSFSSTDGRVYIVQYKKYEWPWQEKDQKVHKTLPRQGSKGTYDIKSGAKMERYNCWQFDRKVWDEDACNRGENASAGSSHSHVRPHTWRVGDSQRSCCYQQVTIMIIMMTVMTVMAMMKMITINVLTLDEWEIVGGHVVINRLW